MATDIRIPEDRAKRHGGDTFYSSGEKFAETFELFGGLRADHRVLDIGCGPGRMAIGIGERFGWTNDYLGFDIIKVDIDVCKYNISEIHDNFRFNHVNAYNGLYNKNGDIAPDAVEFPVDSKIFDFIFATSVFTHMFKKEVEQYLGEIYRALERDGVALTSWFIIDSAVEENIRQGKTRFPFQEAASDGVRYNDTKVPEKSVAFTLSDLEGMLNDAGLSLTHFYRGSWSRVPTSPKPRHSQDFILCRKRS